MTTTAQTHTPSGRRMARARIVAMIAAGALSNFAEGLGALALLWWVLAAGGGATAVGVLAAVSLGVLVLSMLAGGVIVDRFGARRVAILATGVSALLFAVLAGLVASDSALWLVFIVVAIAVLPDGPGATAFDVRLPVLARLARWPLARINAADDVIDGAAAIAGAPAAGLIIAVSTPAAALWIAFAIGMAAAVLAILTLPRDSRRRSRSISLGPALGWLREAAQVRTLVIASAIIVAAFQAVEDVVLPIMLTARGAAPDALGLVFASAGAGGLAGAVAYSALAAKAPQPRVFTGATLLCAIALAALAAPLSFLGILAAAFVAGLGAGALSPLVCTHLMTMTPHAIRGAVLGVIGALILALAPLAALGAGLAVEAFGVGPVTAVLALSVALASAPAWMGTRQASVGPRR